jgi:hypothetical protein
MKKMCLSVHPYVTNIRELILLKFCIKHKFVFLYDFYLLYFVIPSFSFLYLMMKCSFCPKILIDGQESEDIG